MIRKLLVTIVSILALGLGLLHAQGDTTLTVFAAASLTDVFEDLADEFESQTPGVEVLFNFSGSSGLAAQLVEGAPADVFASANIPQMIVVQQARRVTAEVAIFARNRLVVIVPADNPAEIETLQDLANEGVQLLVAAPGVPVREYTDTFLERAAASDEFGADFADAVTTNIVSEEDNVRQVAAKVALGEADAGVVYISDITPDIADNVLTIDIPDNYNTIAEYPIGVIDDTTQPELAQAFVDFVLSETGQALLRDYNFIPVIELEPEATPEMTPESTEAPGT